MDKVVYNFRYMNIKFAKMQGSGNDFMLINGIAYPILPNLNEKLIRQWSDRRTGIGFDQLLIIDNPSSADADFDYRIFNADGSETAQCGNGARCVAHFVTTQGLTDKKTIRLRTLERVIEITMQDDNRIAVDMGGAVFEPERIPFDPTVLTAVGEQIEKKLYSVDIANRELCFSALSFGNPHAVIRVDDIKTAAVAEVGATLQAHRCFPESVNVSFVEVRDDVLYVRVYERGVGETQACGSGACAVASVARLQAWISQALCTVSVRLTGGLLEVQFDEDRVKLIGPAELVYEGRIEV